MDKSHIKIQKTENEDSLTVSYDNSDVEYTIESLNIDPEIMNYRGNEKYTPNQKIMSVMYFLAEGGNIAGAAKKVGIPAATIRKWKSSAPWWSEVVQKCRAIKQDELDAMFTLVIHDSIGEIQDRVQEGDYKLTKDGEIVRVPVSGRDLTLIAATLFDKRNLIRGDPTTISRSKTNNDNLKQIENKLLKVLKDAQGKEVVSTQEPEFEDAT